MKKINLSKLSSKGLKELLLKIRNRLKSSKAREKKR